MLKLRYQSLVNDIYIDDNEIPLNETVNEKVDETPHRWAINN